MNNSRRDNLELGNPKVSENKGIASEPLDSGSYRISLLDVAKPQSTLSKHINSLEQKHGVHIVKRNGQLEYLLTINCEDTLIARSAVGDKGLKDADRQLEQLGKSKEEQLEATFHVSFAKDGEQAVYQLLRAPNGSYTPHGIVTARVPRLKELYGLQEALYHSQPSYIATDHATGVKFYWLKDRHVKGADNLAYYYGKDKDARPSVFFEPILFRQPVTEKDALCLGAGRTHSIEATVVHELAHNAQQNMGWENLQNQARIARDIGWSVFEDAKSHEVRWLLKGRDGQSYRYDYAKGNWISCNSAGQAIDRTGKALAGDNGAIRVSTEELRLRALVKPATEYFPNPQEMFAEAMMIFRLGARERKALLAQSPKLYDAVKKQDELEMSQFFGTDEHGRPLFLRGPDGLPVANNAANQRLLQMFEKALRLTQPAGAPP